MKRTATILAALLTLGAVFGITACEPKQDLTLKISRTIAPTLAVVLASSPTWLGVLLIVALIAYALDGDHSGPG